MNWITNKLFYRKFYNLRHLILKCVKCFKSFSFWIKEYLLPPPPSSPSLLNLLFYLPISFRLIFDSHFMPICARASIYNCGSLFFFQNFHIFDKGVRGFIRSNTRKVWISTAYRAAAIFHTWAQDCGSGSGRIR